MLMNMQVLWQEPQAPELLPPLELLPPELLEPLLELLPPELLALTHMLAGQVSPL
jgi:hypothetical protein